MANLLHKTSIGDCHDQNACGLFFRNREYSAGGQKNSGIRGGDLFEIRPAKPYTQADLDWADNAARSTLEMKDKTMRPEIADKVRDMGQYKTVFLGFPVWWYEAPRIVLTFLDSYNFDGKAMIPFVTSGSSGLGNIPQILEKECPDAHWLPGRRFPAGVENRELESWIKEHVDWKLNK